MTATPDTTKSSAVERLEASLAHIQNEGATVFTDVFVDSARREADAAAFSLSSSLDTIGPIEDEATFHRCNGLVLRNPRIANILDCPSISLTAPFDGLPVGLMLIGRRNTERRLLEIAATIEALLLRRRHADELKPSLIGN